MLNQFKNNNTLKYIVALIIILANNLFSQEINDEYNLELNKISNQVWSQYNNNGQDLSQVQFNYNVSYDSEKTDFKLNFFTLQNKIFIGESFYKVELFNNIYLKTGKYYRDFSIYLNDDLSSGSLLISRNAEPMPKIGLLSSYEINQNLGFSFGISHALFVRNAIYTAAPMLHEKFIYLNYSKNQNEYGVGFVHNAVWGGATEDYGYFPNTFKDFLKIFISADGPLLEGEPHANALGNHLGIWDFHYKKTVDSREIKIYYQHFFEDTSGLRFANKSDGLWGLELYNYINNTKILFEYLNTTNQNRNPPYVQDYYYHHYQYPAGWSYKGYTIGNPFINSGNYSNTNPSQVLHFGIQNYKNDKYKLKLLLARRINIADSIKYKLLVGKTIKSLEWNFFIYGGEGGKRNTGIKINYML
ncbi:capsule assembly Wzi family protein [bacterium]|nr:capsule assembly Wzi family protein [bacterium]